MRLDNSPGPLAYPEGAMRVPENPALLLFGRGSRFGDLAPLAHDGSVTGTHQKSINGQLELAGS